VIITTEDGTRLSCSPIELAELVELDLAVVDIDLTGSCEYDSTEEDDAILEEYLAELECDDYECDCDCPDCTATPSFIERAADLTPEPINRFEGKKVEIEVTPDKYDLTIGGWHILSISKETGKLYRNICADLSGIEADEQGRIVLDEE